MEGIQGLLDFDLNDHSRLDWNTSMMTDLTYIIALGKPLTTASAWSQADSDPAKVTENNIVFHAEALKSHLSFRYSELFQGSSPALLTVLKTLSKRPQSRWDVHKDRGQPLAAGSTLVTLDDLHSYAAFLKKHRRLHAGSCRVTRG